jgi:hypothetical protein
MAIKGKSKPRGRKAVTPGPRPTYVPVKRRWWQKGGFWIGLLVVLVAASVAGIGYGVMREITNNRREADRRALDARRRTAVTRYQAQVEPIIRPLGKAQPPTGFSVFPELSTTVSGFRKGSTSAEEARATVENIGEQAEGAYRALDKVDVLELVQDKGFSESFVMFMLDSKSKMVTALKVFAQAAHLMRNAIGLGGTIQERLVGQAEELTKVATDTFNDGYADYVQVRAVAGVLKPTAPTGAGATIPGVP